MNPPKSQSEFADYEETLRHLAKLPAPADLPERVQARLAAAPCHPQHDWRAFFAELFAPQSGWRKGLAAAAIVLLIFGVGWGIAASIQAPAPSAQAAPPVATTVGGGFSSAGAIRTPQTLQGPAVKDKTDDESTSVTPGDIAPDSRPTQPDGKLPQAPPFK